MAAAMVWCGTASAAAAADNTTVSDETDSLAGIVIGRDWPNWRGPLCSGAAGDSGAELVTDFADAKVAWRSELECQPAWGGPTGRYPTWGYSDFAIVDGKLYYRYTEASGPVSQRDKELALAMLKGNAKVRRALKTDDDFERVAELLGKVRADDVIVCIDAENGRTLWTTNFREQGLSQIHVRPINYSFQGTPAVAYGKVFAMGNGMNVYAVDQQTGEPIWRGDNGEKAMHLWTQYQEVCLRGRKSTKRNRNYSDGASTDGCPMPAGGVVAVGAFDGSAKDSAAMAGLDAATGRRLWRVPNCMGAMNATPLRWRHDGREYIVSAYRDRAVCVEPRTGKELWSVDGFFNSKAMSVVAGDYLVSVGDAWSRGSEHRGPSCLRMRLDGADMLWEYPGSELSGVRYSSPCVYRDIVYIGITKGSSKLRGGVAFDLATGKILGPNAAAKGYNVLAGDGVVWGDKSGSIAVAGSEVTEQSQMPKDFPRPSSETVQVLVGGRLYVRTHDRVACIDLRTGTASAEAGEDPAVAGDIEGLIAQLGHRYQAVRDRAAAALTAHGVDALPALVKALGAENWLVRQAAADALAGLGPTAKPVAGQVAALLPSAVESGAWGQVLVVLRVLEASDITAAAAVVGALADHLGSDDALVMFRAAWALGACGPVAAPAAEALAAQVATDDAFRARWAAEALGKIGPAAEAAVPTLERMLNSSKGDVVAWSLDALRRIGPPASAQAKLVDLMVAPQIGDFTGSCANNFISEFNTPVIAWQAGECLKQLGPDVIPVVAAALSRLRFSQGSGANCMPLEVLAHFGERAQSALPAMREFADPDHPGVQRNYNYRHYCVVMGRPLPEK